MPLNTGMSVVFLKGAKPPIVNPNRVLRSIFLNISHSNDSFGDRVLESILSRDAYNLSALSCRRPQTKHEITSSVTPETAPVMNMGSIATICGYVPIWVKTKINRNIMNIVCNVIIIRTTDNVLSIDRMLFLIVTKSDLIRAKSFDFFIPTLVKY